MATLLFGDGFQGYTKYLGGGRAVDVLSVEEGLYHMCFLTQCCDDTQFYLRIVGRKQGVVLIARNKGLANLATTRGADRNVLEVWLVAAKPTRSGYCLHEGSMDTPCTRVHLTGKGIGVGTL